MGFASNLTALSRLPNWIRGLGKGREKGVGEEGVRKGVGRRRKMVREAIPFF